MAAQEDLAVPYHQQDTGYYCGAACAQMVLDTIGAGLLDQDDLYADNHSHSTTDTGVNWATGPDGLKWTMNDRRPAASDAYFALFALSSEDLISRKICWTIHHYEIAPIALVFGWAHWIVVRGFDASDAPASSGDTSYSITAFDINNPWPPCPSLYDPTQAPPPPHSATDGCGTGGDHGVANEHIPYATWQDDYMTGVPGGHWAGKFIAVCDPEPPGTQIGQPWRPLKRLRGDRLLTAKDAGKQALAGLEAYHLHQRTDWKKRLQKITPGEPALVQRLDRRDTLYYIVPLTSGSKRVTALASVDARYGNYRQAVALPERGRQVTIADFDQNAALRSIVDQRLELPNQLGRVRVRRESLCVCPTLVWRPCRESLSPFWPFYMFNVGGNPIYVRIDGAIFTELHDAEPGI